MGVVRQQLLVCDDIPYTSHNSAACLIAEVPDPSLIEPIIAGAAAHVAAHAAAGSDPGLCVAAEDATGLASIVDFGKRCTHAVATQQQALRSARHVHVSGHGGTNDGIIGAVAAVGLTASGWSGRYIELANFRDWPSRTSVAELSRAGIATVSIDRNACMPAPADRVLTNGWLRPRRIGHRPVLLVRPHGGATWVSIDARRNKGHHQDASEPISSAAAPISPAR